ncbi:MULTISPECIES: hypothetical protein [Mycolicibacter]|uniref:Uncharacterized protein n=2 Tax=Mycolicibacter TaxID=1073531 RepID=A0ABU5XMG5_9MYCO|nr:MULTISPECIES: hypothetical protein [unclassified Mycolicibacter]MEB3022947.1 hypothetical protein [Mycolicibacter sp. MYC098]MEB3035139.1 hypothetical protein [Mycolicibacter sp. MYC340]
MTVPGVVPRMVGDFAAGDAVSMFIGWLNLVDRDGGKVANYRLNLPSSGFNLTSPVCGLVAEFSYDLFLGVAGHAVALINAILNPDAWLEPISKLYDGLTARVYEVIPPVALAVGAFSFLAFNVFVRRGSAGSSVQVSKQQWDRLWSGFLLLGVVAVFASNPFRLIREVLSVVLTFAGFLTRSGDVGVGERVNTAMIDSVRALTFLINYRGELSAECAKAWSKAMNAGGSNPSCLTAQQLANAHPNPANALAALLAVGWAVGLLYFAVVVSLHIFNQLGLTVIYLTGAVYVAGIGMNKRRPFDPLSRTLARFATHGVLTLALWLVAGVGPGWLIFLVMSVGSFLPTWLQVLAMGAVYFYSAKGLRALLDNKETVLKLFRDRIEASKQWSALYANNKTTIVGSMVGGTLDEPKQWVADRYQQLQQFMTSLGQPGIEKGAAMASAHPTIIADSPEFAAATDRADTYNPSEEEKTPTSVTGSDISAPAVLGQVIDHRGEAAAGAVDKVVAITADGGTLIGRPAGLSDLIAPMESPQDGSSLLPIYFRGGIGQAMAPFLVPQGNAGAAPHAADVPAPAPSAGRHDPFDSVMSQYWQHLDALSGRMKAEIAALNGRGAVQPDEVAVGTATFGPVESMPPGVAGRGPVGFAVRRPEFRSLLDPAARSQRLAHNRNVLRARGVEAAVVISDEDEAAEELVFVTGPDGKNRVERRNGVGFGDAI